MQAKTLAKMLRSKRASLEGGRRQSVDGDEAHILNGPNPRFQEQQIELLEAELDEMNERFVKQEELLNILQACSTKPYAVLYSPCALLCSLKKLPHSAQAEIDELNEEKSISAPLGLSQLALEAAPEELKAILATACEEARTCAKAQMAASGTIKELRALVAKLECKLKTAREIELVRTADQTQGRPGTRVSTTFREKYTPWLAEPVAAGAVYSKEYMVALTNEARAAVKIQAVARGQTGRTEYQLVHDSKACRQWVAYHVSLGDYRNAVELGWDGTNPPAPKEQELLKANLAAHAKDDKSMRVAPESPRDICIEAFARSPVTLHPRSLVLGGEQIEVVARSPFCADGPQSDMVEVTAHVSPKQRPERQNTNGGLVRKLMQDDKMVDMRPAKDLKTLESALVFERLNSANNEATERVSERLERARQHNRQVARLAAALATVGRHARGHLTRAQLQREREAERMAELQRETEKVWAKTLSRPAPNGRRGKLTRRQYVLEREALTAYFNLQGLPPPDSELARHARALASAITQRRAKIDERIEGILQGTVVVIDPRVTREERLRDKRLGVSASPGPPQALRPTQPKPKPKAPDVNSNLRQARPLRRCCIPMCHLAVIR